MADYDLLFLGLRAQELTIEAPAFQHHGVVRAQDIFGGHEQILELAAVFGLRAENLVGDQVADVETAPRGRELLFGVRLMRLLVRACEITPEGKRSIIKDLDIRK